MTKHVHPSLPYLTWLLALLCLLRATARADECCVGLRGNVDSDASDAVNIIDITRLVSYYFSGGEAPECPEEADVNADGSSNIVDLTRLTAYLFQAGEPPADCPAVVVDDVIQPLAIGNVFVGLVTTYNAGGGVVDTATQYTAVVADTVIDDWTWFVMGDEQGQPADTAYSTNRPDGLWTWSSPTADPPGDKQLALKHPANTGDSYPLQDFTVTVMSTSEALTVPAGTFSCYRYKVTALLGIKVGEIWAAPNVGIVRADVYGLSGFQVYLQTRMVLVSYMLAS